MTARPKPGDTVKFNLQFTGIVVKTSPRFLRVRTKRNDIDIPIEDLVEVLEPEPDEADVIAEEPCSGCWVDPGEPCRHKQTLETIKHPHKERVRLYQRNHS